MCSTPFGITDYIGLRLPWRSAGGSLGAQRLSASRIISVLRRHASGSGSRCAQRLSASRIISEESALSHSSYAWLMCSTPFGITDYIGSPRSPRTTSAAACAQRLSASRIISATRRGRGTRCPISVLNAFRHHGLYRIRAVVVGRLERGMCSTPFGITDYIGPVHRDPASAPS